MPIPQTPNKTPTVIINQFFGAGDIIFCQSIANRLVEDGYKVLWPVTDIYAPLAKHFPNITMIDKKLLNIDYMRRDEYEYNGCLVIPLRFSDSIMQVPYLDCMKSKYMLMGQDWEEWKENCIIKRDYDAECELFFDVLGLKVGEKYNLISEQFGTGGTRTTSIMVDNGLRNVDMKFIEGYTLIDWLKVMEHATNIHVVSSSNIYLFELFPTIQGEINIYIRKPIEQNHDLYKYLLTSHNYILHD